MEYDTMTCMRPPRRQEPDLGIQGKHASFQAGEVTAFPARKYLTNVDIRMQA